MKPSKPPTAQSKPPSAFKKPPTPQSKTTSTPSAENDAQKRLGKKEKKNHSEKKKRYSLSRGKTFDVIPEDEPLNLPESDNLSDYYEVAPERLEVIALPPEELFQKKDRSLSLGALAGTLSFFKNNSK